MLVIHAPMEPVIVELVLEVGLVQNTLFLQIWTPYNGPASGALYMIDKALRVTQIQQPGNQQFLSVVINSNLKGQKKLNQLALIYGPGGSTVSCTLWDPKSGKYLIVSNISSSFVNSTPPNQLDAILDPYYDSDQDDIYMLIYPNEGSYVVFLNIWDVYTGQVRALNLGNLKQGISQFGYSQALKKTPSTCRRLYHLFGRYHHRKIGRFCCSASVLLLFLKWICY